MKFAKVDEVKKGDILITDGGFTCMKEGEEKKVKKFSSILGRRGGLYIECKDGKHFLDGQIDGNDEYVGLYRKEEASG